MLRQRAGVRVVRLAHAHDEVSIGRQVQRPGLLDPTLIASRAPLLLSLLQHPSANTRTNVIHALRPLGVVLDGLGDNCRT